ncbi:phytase [Alteromonadaceae bacterium BrNp21-10]|nr:phytase [Alteromonadaceae bacterium BrNp21-10]
MKLFFVFVLACAQLSLSACASTEVGKQTSLMPLANNADIAGKSAVPIIHQDQQYWLLTSESLGILLTDSQGQTISRYPGNMELIDWRDNIQVNGQSMGLIATVENESSRTLILGINWQTQSLELLNTLAASNAATEALCWYHMPEGHLSLFSVDSVGMVQQRLIVNGNTQQLTDTAIREFIGTPESKGCAVDDQQGALYLVEANIGLWRYAADAEAELQRDLVFAAKPNGKLMGEATYVSVLPDSSLLLSAPEQQGFWHIDPEQPQAAQFFELSGSKAPESVNALVMDNGLLLGVFDDDDTRYYQSVQAIELNLEKPTVSANAVVTLMPVVETQAVERFGDAADDPAVWVNTHNPAQSRILGTDKKQGLMLYDLQGNLLQKLNVGRVNNVDVRYDFEYNGKVFDIAAASNRTHNSISLFAIDQQSGELSLLADLATDLDDVYGLCLYQHQQNYHVFINGTDGRFQQYQLAKQNSHISAELVREFKVASQPEGCVVDDQSGELFFGEEARGVWKVSAAPSKQQPRLIAEVNKKFQEDVEGMGIYRIADQRYLVVSSQGINNYAVFALDDHNRYLGSFAIGMNVIDGIDGVSETDGLEVTSVFLGDAFPDGLMVAQDGRNVMPAQPQNFKVVNASALRQQIETWLQTTD